MVHRAPSINKVCQELKCVPSYAKQEKEKEIDLLRFIKLTIIKRFEVLAVYNH